jgi:hypothetical protein
MAAPVIGPEDGDGGFGQLCGHRLAIGFGGPATAASHYLKLYDK